MDKKKFLNSGLLEQYILGLTSPEESREVERYAEAFPEIQAEIDSMRNALENYARQYAQQPPEELRKRVIESVDPAPSLVSTQTSSPWQRWISYASLIALVAGVLYFGNQLNASKQQLSGVRKELAVCHANNENMTNALNVVAFLNDNTTEAVVLKSVQDGTSAQTLALWNPDQKKGMVNAAQLPALPANQQYQVWVDVEGEMISVGLLANEVSEWQEIKYIPHAESLNITIEPAGGSMTPTVAQLFVNGNIG